MSGLRHHPEDRALRRGGDRSAQPRGRTGQRAAARLARRLPRRRRVGHRAGAAGGAGAAGRADHHCLRQRVRQLRKARRRFRQGGAQERPEADARSTWPISNWPTSTKAKRLVFIAATWGEGEPPARAVRAYGELMGEGAPRLDGVEFGVLALGDTAYAEFCAIGKKIDERLAALGGKRVVERVDCDLDFAAPAAAWIGDALKVLTPPDADRGRVIEVDFGKPQACAEHRYRRGRGQRARQSQFLALEQGNHPSRARLRWRGAGL